MARANQLAASLLFAAGIVLVFAGLSSALGFTVIGMLASVAVIAGLLYAGATWFVTPSSAAAAPTVLFDHRLETAPGVSLLALYPEALHADLRAHCLLALSGERARFTVDGRAFQALPVVDVDGVVRCAVLVEGSAALASTL